MVFLKGSSYLQNGEHCSGDSPKESFGFLQRCGLQEEASLTLWPMRAPEDVQPRDPFHFLCTSPLSHVEQSPHFGDEETEAQNDVS